MSTKKLCAMGLLVALTCVATMIIQIPIPATQGYVNIGDSIVLISAIFFGPQVGFVAGGLGSGLADLLSGYPQWAIATFIIKGIHLPALSLFLRRSQRHLSGQRYLPA